MIRMIFFLLVFTVSNWALPNYSYENESDLSEIVLREDSIDKFSLPFPEKKMFNEQALFYERFVVKEEIGMQDGPDFPSISFYDNNNEVLFFKFDPENRLLLDKVIVSNSIVRDEYGLQVGLTVSNIIKNRGTDFRITTDAHQHTYLKNERSKISYEIGVSSFISDAELSSVSSSDFKALENATIERIIWTNKKIDSN